MLQSLLLHCMDNCRIYHDLDIRHKEGDCSALPGLQAFGKVVRLEVHIPGAGKDLLPGLRAYMDIITQDPGYCTFRYSSLLCYILDCNDLSLHRTNIPYLVFLSKTISIHLKLKQPISIPLLIFHQTIAAIVRFLLWIS